MSGKSAVGRTGSLRVFKYPEPRFGGSAGLFARNFASGPKEQVVLGDGTLVAWNAIDVAPATPSTDVPITPLSTGWIRISGVISIVNVGEGGASTGEIAIEVDGTPVPVPEMEFSVEDAGAVLLPFLVEVELPIGVEANVSVSVTADDADTLALNPDGSTMELLEVPESTG